MNVSGRVWLFGNDVNTDVMYPNQLSHKATGSFTRAERRSLAFSGIRPGWSETVREGDLIVAGQNFGTGSGRPAPVLIKEIGIAGIVAESINGLFMRNCINAGLPALRCPGITGIVAEGEHIRVDFAAGTVENISRDGVLHTAGLPPEMLVILNSGGLMRALEAQGYLLPQP